MAFHENAVFPSKIAAESTFGWGFNTAVLATTGGQEQRISRREVVQHVGDVSTGISGPDELYLLKRFHLGRRGALYGWRFLDPLDHMSNFLDPTLSNVAPAATDQIIGSGDGSTTQFQLTKTYEDTDLNYVRKITKPIAGSVLIAVNGTPQGSGWSVNTTNGIVTFNSAPSFGATITAGYRFHTPVRFEVDADRALEIAFRQFKYGSIPRIGIIELLDEGVADEDAWFGGGGTYALSADASFTPLNGRYLGIAPTGTGYSAYLPNAASLTVGGPHFFIHNPNVGAPTFSIRDAGGALITTCAAGEVYEMVVAKNSSNLNFWLALRG